MHKIKILMAAAIMTFSLVAAAQERSNMPSIVIKQGMSQTKTMPISEGERDYWECVLKHMKGTQSDEAVNVILAACRALYGSAPVE